MTRAGFSHVLFLAVAVLLMAGQQPLAEDSKLKTKILKYDQNGKVIGVVSDSNDAGGSSGSSSNASAGKGQDLRKSGAFNPEKRFEEGEVLVLNPNRSFIKGVRNLGYNVEETVSMKALRLTIVRLRTPPGADVMESIRQLRSRYPRFEIDANHQFDPSASTEHRKKMARALIKWNRAKASCGKGARIGMIDSGVDVSHPALKGQNIVYRSFHKENRKPGPKMHGTAIASILVGKPKWGGLLPGAQLRAANMFEYDESGREIGSAMALIKAANWMIHERVDIINLSIAGADNRVLKKVFQKGLKKRVILVAAAGNWGRKDKPAFPAGYKNVIAVTAIGGKNKIYSKANQGDYIEFSAPGVRIYTAVPGGGRLQSGTSFAVPFITAMLALEMANGKPKEVDKLRSAIRSQVKDIGSPGRDKVYGWGAARTSPKC